MVKERCMFFMGLKPPTVGGFLLELRSFSWRSKKKFTKTSFKTEVKFFKQYF
jgi:hypothetical protein